MSGAARFLRGLTLGLLLWGAPRAAALEPIEDHRDQWGLTLSLGTSYDTAINQKEVPCIAPTPGNCNYAYHPGFEPIVELGATRAVTDTGDEVTLRLRFVAPVTRDTSDDFALQSSGDSLHWLGPSLIAGYRGYFGYESFKTFYDADLYLNSFPYWGFGPDIGLGAQYDFGRIAGIFLRLGFGVTFGETFIASFDGSVGGQVRF